MALECQAYNRQPAGPCLQASMAHAKAKAARPEIGRFLFITGYVSVDFKCSQRMVFYLNYDFNRKIAPFVY